MRTLWDSAVENGKRQLRLTQKELRETLRDRRTVVTLILMPLLVYPLLSMALQRLLLSGTAATAPVPASIVWASPNDVEMLVPLLQQGHQAVTAGDSQQNMEPWTTYVVDPELEQQSVEHFVRQGQADLGVQLERIADQTYRLRLFYREEPTSLRVLAEFQRLVWMGERVALQEQLRHAGANNHTPQLSLELKKIEPEKAPSPLATLVPLVLILMTITGGVYPAIDLTAGERERGTLETLMAAPVARWRLLLAKYVAVVVVALLTATVNLLAMTVTVEVAGLSTVIFGPSGLSVGSVAMVCLLLLLFAGFFAAVLLSITSVARSFKEAQAYLIPMMLVALAPGFLSMMPGLKLTGTLATLPLVNIVLVARDLFQGTADFYLVAVVLFTTFLYAAASLSVAAYVFGNDAILYGSSYGWADVFRRPALAPRTLPLSAAWASVAIAFPLHYIAAGLVAHAFPGPTHRVLAAGLATAIIYGILPWLLWKWNRVIDRSLWRLGERPTAAITWAVVLGVSLWPLAHALLVISTRWGWVTLDAASWERAHQLAVQFQQLPTWLVLLTMGLAPGICEEWFFRGMLLPAFQARFGNTASILVTALLFAAFHLITPQVLAVERFLPSFALGLVLGTLYLVHRSVLPCMLTHSLHNCLLLSLTAVYRSDVTLPAPMDRWLHPSWYALSAFGLSVWTIWFLWTLRPSVRHSATASFSGPR